MSRTRTVPSFVPLVFHNSAESTFVAEPLKKYVPPTAAPAPGPSMSVVWLISATSVGAAAKRQRGSSASAHGTIAGPDIRCFDMGDGSPRATANVQALVGSLP